jgi:catechol 2,3-dioxygenase-like lactoylglutathione lyase family enzyme
VRIDHAIWAVHDLEAGVARFEEATGLTSVPGGVHPRWGTGNAIVPLGDTYLELMAPVDPDAALATRLGRRLFGRLREGEGWFAYCVADDAIEATAARLGLEVEPGSRERPDGTRISWRGAGIEAAERTPDLPFFIAWEVPAGSHPGAAAVTHPCGATGIAWLEVAGDRATFDAWTADAGLAVRHVAGPPRVVRVGLTSPRGDITI